MSTPLEVVEGADSDNQPASHSALAFSKEAALKIPRVRPADGTGRRARRRGRRRPGRRLPVQPAGQRGPAVSARLLRREASNHRLFRVVLATTKEIVTYALAPNAATAKRIALKGEFGPLGSFSEIKDGKAVAISAARVSSANIPADDVDVLPWKSNPRCDCSRCGSECPVGSWDVEGDIELFTRSLSDDANVVVHCALIPDRSIADLGNESVLGEGIRLFLEENCLEERQVDSASVVSEIKARLAKWGRT